MKKFYILFIGLVMITISSCDLTESEFLDYHNKILFTSSRSGKEQLYMMNPDGTDIVQITKGKYWHNNGRWSPDAQKIVCNTEEDITTAGIEMVVMNSDGSNRKLLGYGNQMSWSTAGNKIAFIHLPMAEIGLRFRFIYTINTDGSGGKQITKDSLEIISSPCWSNEVNKLYFVSNRYDVTNYDVSELYYMNNDGTNVTRLTYTLDGKSYSPSISPLNSKIVFMSTMNGAAKGSIYICDIDGGNITLLLTPAEIEIYNFPRWSPDEQYIIFTGILSNGTEKKSIYKVEVDGNNLTQLADNASNPDWIK